MTLKEMQTCAAETLSYFLEVMPEAPFTAEDIIIELAPKEQMAERAMALCEKYVPDKHLNESQAAQLVNSIAGNALIGREKSAVLCFIDYNANRHWFRQMLFHEFAHIFCAKSEMDGEHFIDIYGSGTTPENPNMTPDEKTYDGYLASGYAVWSEFIAQFLALVFTEPGDYRIADVLEYLGRFVPEISAASGDNDKAALAMICATLLSCVDANNARARSRMLNTFFPKTRPFAQEVRQAFSECLRLLQSHLEREQPWKITEEFIAELGTKFVLFKMMNSVYCGTFG